MNRIRQLLPKMSCLNILFGSLVALVCLQTTSNAQEKQPRFTLAAILLTSCNDYVSQIIPLPDSKLLVIGGFTEIGGYTRNGFARLNADGTMDTDFDCKADSRPKRVAVQSDGKILVTGRFYEIGGYRGPQPKVVRLHPDGRYDSSFAKLDLLGRVNCISVQPDGKILLGGCIYSIAGIDVGSLARVNADGTLDETFHTRVATLEGQRLANVTDGDYEWKKACLESGAGEWPSLTAPGENVAGLRPSPPRAKFPSLKELDDDVEINCAEGISITGSMIETETSDSTGNVLVSVKNESRDGYLIIRAKKHLQVR